MLFENYSHKFTTDRGRLIFVPTTKSRIRGQKIHNALLRKWRPPPYFFHLHDGGHVAAAKLHLPNSLFVRLDLTKYYHSVSRAKIHRALRKLKYPHSIALEIATYSTVSQDPVKRDYYSLPFGFIQSPILASLVLDGSVLGRTAFRMVKSGVTLSIYMDDFILSGRDEETLRLAREELEAAATLANFQFNPLKSVGPASAIEAFNLDISASSLRVNAARMAAFAEAIANGDAPTVEGILGYVGTVNVGQRKLLEAIT